MAQVRWGVLSTANIGMAKVTPAIQQAQNSEVVAIASRDADQAAAAAGKHVLCEEPLAMSAAQADEMVRACEEAGVLLAEAFMYRHHPTWVEAASLVADGAIGQLQAVQSWFSYFNDDPTNIRDRVANGGGAVMDIGCYCIHSARLLFGQEPASVQAVVRRDPDMGIDVVTSAVLEFPGGARRASPARPVRSPTSGCTSSVPPDGSRSRSRSTSRPIARRGSA